MYSLPETDRRYAEVLKSARDSGIVTVMSNNYPGDGVLDCYVGNDEFQMGAMMAAMVSEYIDETWPDAGAGEVPVLTLEASFNENAIRRCLGMRLIAEKYLREGDITSGYFVKEDGDPVYYLDEDGNEVEVDEPTGGLAYITNDDQKTLVPEIQTMEASLAFRYAPGETFVNTKQRRIPVSFDAPVFTLSHTAGFKGVLGGEYNYNLTEIGLYKRFWFSSWGKIDMFVKGGAQWNKVPFPLLIMPAANLSYILQRETFNLINNMEFLNDRYASLDVSWDLNGKIFNRIPLLKKLKWREAIGFKMLYGHLTDKNNPMKHPGDSELFLFPTRDGRPTSFVMDPKTPYMECSVGIHNIFKILHIDYVRRLNYLDHPDANKWGVRFMVMMTF